MSGPFSNSTEGDLFTANRCDRCIHRTGLDEPCDDFLPAYLDEWPVILTRVPISAQNPIGVECTRFTQSRGES